METITYLVLSQLKKELKTSKKVAAFLDVHTGLIKFYLSDPSIDASSYYRKRFILGLMELKGGRVNRASTLGI